MLLKRLMNAGSPIKITAPIKQRLVISMSPLPLQPSSYKRGGGGGRGSLYKEFNSNGKFCNNENNELK